MSLKDQLKIPIKCPKCGHQFEQAMARLKPGKQDVTCPGCGCVIALNMRGASPQKIVGAADELDRSIEKLRKRGKKRR